MKNSSNLNISCKVVFSLNKWNKKVGSPSSFGRKRPFISLNCSASIENLSRSERPRARARANHAINDAQKGCAMQLNGITLKVITCYVPACTAILPNNFIKFVVVLVFLFIYLFIYLFCRLITSLNLSSFVYKCVIFQVSLRFSIDLFKHLSMLSPRVVVGGGALPPGNMTFLEKPESNSLPSDN